VPASRPGVQDGILKTPVSRFDSHDNKVATATARSPALSDNAPGGQFQRIANRRIQKHEEEIADLERNKDDAMEEIYQCDAEIQELLTKLAAAEVKKAEKMIETTGLDEELSLSRLAMECIKREVQAREARAATPDASGSGSGFA
jgi:peptidoglycan hydrolase CwlO-like protein